MWIFCDSDDGVPKKPSPVPRGTLARFWQSSNENLVQISNFGKAKIENCKIGAGKTVVRFWILAEFEKIQFTIFQLLTKFMKIVLAYLNWGVLLARSSLGSECLVFYDTP